MVKRSALNFNGFISGKFDAVLKVRFGNESYVNAVHIDLQLAQYFSILRKYFLC